jgi:hypothetical protein
LFGSGSELGMEVTVDLKATHLRSVPVSTALQQDALVGITGAIHLRLVNSVLVVTILRLLSSLLLLGHLLSHLLTIRLGLLSIQLVLLLLSRMLLLLLLLLILGLRLLLLLLLLLHWLA